MSKREIGDAVVDILEREGVSHVFGVPGGPILGLCDAIERSSKISFVLTRHEQGAAYAAFAYARATGALGVCAATLGPGATNLVAGLPVAAIESVPVLAVTGEVQPSGVGRGAHQESSGWFQTPDQRAMFGAVCKNSALCADPALLPDVLRHSIRIARSGRPGPVHVCVPSGGFHGRIPYVPLDPASYRLTKTRLVDDDAAQRIAGRITAADRPVLLVGSRATGPTCGEMLERLADRGVIAIAADLGGKSVVAETHPYYLGCIGVLGHRAAERCLKEEADLIVSVGMTFDEISTLAWDPRFADRRQLVQLDCCPEEIGKAFPVVDASVGDLPALIERIADYLALGPDPTRNRRAGWIADLRSRHPLFADREAASAKVPALPQRIVADLRAGLPDDAILLSDSSKWARWLGRHFQAARGQLISAHDYEPMGWAVAGALGAKLAFPDRPVVCVSGDGAFMMSAMELATARQQRLPIIWVVMNDGRLGIIYDLQKSLFHGRVVGTSYDSIDLAAFAAAVGMESATIEKPGALADVLRDAVARNVAMLIDVRFDADEIPAVRPRSLLVTKGMGLPPPSPGPETTRALIKLLKER